MPKELLIKSGHVVTVDPDLGDLPSGDVLVTDGVITAVGTDLTPATADAEVIDAAGPNAMGFRANGASGGSGS
jgi:5-methylthioadenosine/S-adenosylhomocysteine deaminase